MIASLRGIEKKKFKQDDEGEEGTIEIKTSMKRQG